MPQRRKSIEEHKMNGTYRPSIHDRNTPKVEKIKTIPEPPKDFNKYAKKEWKRIVPELVEKGLLQKIDLGLLEVAVFHYGIYRECWEYIYTEEYIDKSGKRRKKKRNLIDYFKENSSSQKTPWVSMMKDSFKKYYDIMLKFGFTPVERTKVNLDITKIENVKNPILEIINKKE